MFEDYSGFYFNKQGLYENIVYYISPGQEQELYLIRKYGVMLNTNNVLKSIETGFNGYDYEIYKVILKTKAVDNPDNDDEVIAIVDFIDFSNRQQFEGVIIIDKDMPMYDRLDDYLFEHTRDLPLIVEGRDPRNKLITDIVQQEQMAQEQKQAQEQKVVQEVKEEPKAEEPKVQTKDEDFFKEIDEKEEPKNFNEQLKTPQQRAIEDSQTLAFQIVKNNEELDNQETNNQ